MPAASAAIGNSEVSVRPGHRVHLQHLRSALAQDQVDAGESLAAQRLPGPNRGVADGRQVDLVELGRAGELGAADLVARLVGVAVLVARADLDDRQRLAVEHRDRELAPVDVLLEQDPVVVGERGDDRLRHGLAVGGEPDAERRAAAGGLHHKRKPEAVLDLVERVGGAQLGERGLRERDPVGRVDPGLAKLLLGGGLVHRAPAGADPGPGVRDREDLEQLLDGAVLAVGPVEGDERDVGAGVLQLPHEVVARVDRDHVVPARGQRVLDPGAAAQRHLPLERPPALQHGDLHAAAPASASAPRLAAVRRRSAERVREPVLPRDRPVQVDLLVHDPPDPLAPPRGSRPRPRPRS